MTRERLRRADPGSLAAWMIALLVATLGFASLDQYNVTWDEALGDLFFGERYLSYFTSFDRVYLDVRADPYPEDHRPDLGRSPFRGRPWEYYPFANTAAAATSHVLSRRFGWLDPFDGFHALNVVLACVLVVVFHGFLRRRFGVLAATAALGFLFGAPRIVFHMLANIKDFPLMVLWTLAACAFLAAWERGSPWGLSGVACLVGLALATKGNALFFPILPGLVLFVGGVPASWGGARRLAVGVASAALVAPMVMLAVWPYLWPAPIERFAKHLDYLVNRQDYTADASIAPVFEAILWTTPPVFLVFAAVGALWAAHRIVRGPRSKRRAEIFLLAWPVASLGRYAIPQAINFDGVRHFLELFPALAALAGIGAAVTARWLARWLVQHLARRTMGQDAAAHDEPRRRRLVAALVVGATLLPGTWAVLRTHPFQSCYWNVLVGGFDGAYDRGLPQASDYWGASYRLGLRWLGEHAEPGAYLAVPVVEHAVYLVAPERLRADLTLLPVTTPFSPRIAPDRLQKTRELAVEKPVYVMFVERRDWANELMVDCLRFLEPEVTWTLEGAPVLSIYRYRPPPGWPTAPQNAQP